MGLSKQSVDKAIELFNAVDNKRQHRIQECKDYKTNFDTIYIFGIYYEPIYGGWENVWINVKNITPEQMAIWNEGRKEIGNTSFDDKGPDNVTRLGFI